MFDGSSRSGLNASSPLLQNTVVRRSIIFLLFVSAFVIRLYHIDRPPLDFSPVRQYQSAHIARDIYFRGIDTISESRKRIAKINSERIGFALEPRFMENASVTGYRIIGGERLWIPRVMSSIFWMIGGIFVYLTACMLSTRGAALFSASFFVLFPYGILASRSFQPDPLMTMLITCGIFLILKYHERPSFLTLLYASSASSLAVLLKPYSIFMTLGVFFSLSLYRQGLRKSIINRDMLIFCFLSILLPATYYVSGMLTGAGNIREHAQGSFYPHLLLEPYFWKDWLNIIGRVFGYIPFICAFTGIFMFQGHMQKFLLSGLWISYFLFGLMFTFHIHTHDYYQMPFIPVVALSIGPFAARIYNYIPQFFNNRKFAVSSATVVFAVVLAAGSGFRHAGLKNYKDQIKAFGSFTGINPQFYDFLMKDYKTELKAAREIGEIIGHSTNTVFLTPDYGRSLTYHGELAGLPWPISLSLKNRKERKIPIPDKEELFNPHYLLIRTYKSELFNTTSAPGGYIRYKPDYFIITALEEFKRQPDLKDFLYINFPVFAKSEYYLIFDLRKMSE